MRFPSLVVAVAVASVVPAADVTTLAGKKLVGEVVAISPAGVGIKSADGTTTTIPAKELLLVEFAAESTQREPHTEVELTDGSILQCSAVTIKGQDVELKVRAGYSVQCPLSSVASLLNNAHDPAVKQEWRQLLRKRGQYDMLVVRSEGKLDGLDGTFGPGTPEGDAIEFALASGDRSLKPKLARVQGLLFVRKAAVEVPPVFAKVTALSGDLLVTKSAALAGTDLTVELVGGGRAVVPLTQVARLDFSKGKLAYLSDLEPIEVDQSSTEDLVFPYRRDRNLSGGPIRVKGVPHAKGLSLHARTVLTYDIAGDFNEFRCLVGIDDSVRTEGGSPVHALVSIEADGRPLWKKDVKSREEPEAIALNVKNVRRLKITVASPLLDLGNQVVLADARVSK